MQASLAAGVDLVCFSGDKMLGGPQAGIVLGQRRSWTVCAPIPLMRALRVDKLTYAALEGTLLEHRAGRAHDTVPVLRMLHIPKDAITARARAVAEALGAGGWETTVVDGASAIGGGSAPGVAVPTSLVRLAWPGWSADRLEGWLRRLDPPVIARIQDGSVVLDVRTVAPEDDTVLASLPAAVTD